MLWGWGAPGERLATVTEETEDRGARGGSGNTGGWGAMAKRSPHQQRSEPQPRHSRSLIPGEAVHPKNKATAQGPRLHIHLQNTGNKRTAEQRLNPRHFTRPRLVTSTLLTPLFHLPPSP